MIDEKKLIDELYDDFDYGRIESFDDVIYTIEHQPKVGEWIPCAERLPCFYPEKQRRVLVTVEDLSGKRFVATAKYDENYEQWKDFKDPRYYDFKVVAWQTKPEPYKEGCK